MTIKECINCKIKSKAAGTLNEEELEFLGQNCTEILLQKGETILREGRIASHIAYIKSGLAKLHMKGPAGRDQILKIVTPCSYLGIETVMLQKIHSYSASVLMDAKVCYVDIRSFRDLISRNPGFASEIILYLCQDELSYFGRFVNLSQKQVIGRLADALLFFSTDVYHKPVFEIPLSRSDLSALIGATRETVTRGLKGLSDDGIIRIKGRKVEIVEVQRLESVARRG